MPQSSPSDVVADLPELAGYDLVDEIGRGGMGVVYEAYQRSTGRRVAVKFMLDGAAASEHGVDMTLSAPGQIIGTLGYMSPEQSRGLYQEMSVRSDVYALGAITYQMLTGELPCPVAGALSDVLFGIAQREPRQASSVR